MMLKVIKSKLKQTKPIQEHYCALCHQLIKIGDTAYSGKFFMPGSGGYPQRKLICKVCYDKLE